jgi:hypothetical protein
MLMTQKFPWNPQAIRIKFICGKSTKKKHYIYDIKN